MSSWTHITSCMSVDTHHCSKNLVEEVKEYLKNAPEIYGSERNADIFINLQGGYNCWFSHDCDHCEYQDTLRDVKDGDNEYEECDAPEGYDCSSEYQTCVVISIQGDLRDTTKEETHANFEKFKSYVEAKYLIRDYSINVEGDC